MEGIAHEGSIVGRRLCPVTGAASRSRSDLTVEEPLAPGAILCIPIADDVRRGLTATNPWESRQGQPSVSLVMLSMLPCPSNSPESSSIVNEIQLWDALFCVSAVAWVHMYRTRGTYVPRGGLTYVPNVGDICRSICLRRVIQHLTALLEASVSQGCKVRPQGYSRSSLSPVRYSTPAQRPREGR